MNEMNMNEETILNYYNFAEFSTNCSAIGFDIYYCKILFFENELQNVSNKFSMLW